MITTLVVVFLLPHGLVHFAVWLPHPEPDPTYPAPSEEANSHPRGTAGLESACDPRV